ncbi:MAG: four helix bundle protein [Phycisphaerales bacterium]|nr:MAG: four helix bundle protein [Phycisphaerales bacterium]
MSAQVNTYRDLIAWQKAFTLGISVYRLTKSMPDNERFGLISQLRRSAVSVPSNIAEGYGRGSTNDYVRFLKVARGSLYELETQLLLANELEYVPQDAAKQILDELAETERVLAGLIRGVER